MAKLDYFHHKSLNPSDELRQALNSLEEWRTAMKNMDQHQALTYLHNLDRAHQLFQTLEAREVDLSPERGRFDSIQGRLRRDPGTLLKRLGGAAMLVEQRPTPSPAEEERWWWYINDMVAERRQRLLQRVTIGLIVVLVVIAGIALAFQTILAPSPQAIARMEAEGDSLAAYEEGDYEMALAEIEQGLEVVPNEPGLLIYKGLFLEVLERDAEATESYELAQDNLADPAVFYLGRGQLYFRTGQLAKAEADARSAVQLDEQLARGWLLLGQSLEYQGKRFASIRAYEQAGEVGLANGEDQVVVLARMALGRIGVPPSQAGENNN